jgi:hypothetical protein
MRARRSQVGASVHGIMGHAVRLWQLAEHLHANVLSAGKLSSTACTESDARRVSICHCKLLPSIGTANLLALVVGAVPRVVAFRLVLSLSFTSCLALPGRAQD